MAHIELMALGQDLRDAAAMAHLPVGSVTQHAARHRFGNFTYPYPRFLPVPGLWVSRGPLAELAAAKL
jgi:hypothetical protein